MTIAVCQDGGPSLEGTKPQVFLLKDNFLFVFNSETEVIYCPFKYSQTPLIPTLRGP